MGFVSIPEEEYYQLLERDAWLNCLEAAGVDNWSGYGDAQSLMDEAEDDSDVDEI